MSIGPREGEGPLEISLADFLCGATEPDRWCRQAFADYLGYIQTEIDEGPWPLGVCSPTHAYALAHSKDSVLLLASPLVGSLAGSLAGPRARPPGAAPWEVVGYYNPPGAVCVREDHQGVGLGAELILHTALHFCGGPPTAGLDEQCFTVPGLAAHCAAWRLGVRRGLIVDPINAAKLAVPKPPRCR